MDIETAPEDEVLQGRQIVVQCNLLRHYTHLVFQRTGVVVKVIAANVDTAIIGRHNAADHMNSGRLSGTIRTQ